jgi:hypothetical protein
VGGGLETWLQPHGSRIQDHGTSQAMKRMKEKSGKHLCLIDAMSRNTFALHNYLFWSLDVASKVAEQQIMHLRTAQMVTHHSFSTAHRVPGIEDRRDGTVDRSNGLAKAVRVPHVTRVKSNINPIPCHVRR